MELKVKEGMAIFTRINPLLNGIVGLNWYTTIILDIPKLAEISKKI